MAKTETSRSERTRSPADPSADDDAPAESDAPRKRTNRGSRTPPRRNATSTAGEKAGAEVAGSLVVDQELSENLTRTILPVVQEVSDGVIRAVEPVLQGYQEDVAEAMEEQVKRAFPTAGEAVGQDAKGDEEQPVRGRAGEHESSKTQFEGDTQFDLDDPEDARQPSSTATEAPGDNSPLDEATTSSRSTGGTQMAADTAKPDKTTSDESQARSQPAQSRTSPQREGGNLGHSAARTYYYNPQAAARAGLLRLASDWKEAGSAYQAMHAYMEILRRYPQTGAAAAATEGLVDLANRLQKQGKFYAALNIYDKLDAML